MPKIQRVYMTRQKGASAKKNKKQTPSKFAKSKESMIKFNFFTWIKNIKLHPQVFLLRKQTSQRKRWQIIMSGKLRKEEIGNPMTKWSYSINASKTIQIGVEKLFSFFFEEDFRAKNSPNL